MKSLSRVSPFVPCGEGPWVMPLPVTAIPILGMWGSFSSSNPPKTLQCLAQKNPLMS